MVVGAGGGGGGGGGMVSVDPVGIGGEGRGDEKTERKKRVEGPGIPPSFRAWNAAGVQEHRQRRSIKKKKGRMGGVGGETERQGETGDLGGGGGGGLGISLGSRARARQGCRRSRTQTERAPHLY